MSRRTKFVFLQIKIKSLAAEGAAIHREERKWPRPSEANGKDSCYVRGQLREHRIMVVRREARAAQLAYGFLRNKPYKSIETSCHEEPKWDRVADIAARFAGGQYQSKVDTIRKIEVFNQVRSWAKGESVLPCPKSAHPGGPVLELQIQA